MREISRSEGEHLPLPGSEKALKSGNFRFGPSGRLGWLRRRLLPVVGLWGAVVAIPLGAAARPLCLGLLLICLSLPGGGFSSRPAQAQAQDGRQPAAGAVAPLREIDIDEDAAGQAIEAIRRYPVPRIWRAGRFPLAVSLTIDAVLGENRCTQRMRQEYADVLAVMNRDGLLLRAVSPEDPDLAVALHIGPYEGWVQSSSPAP